jgi:nucleoside-diphosphate-sugar epimerase
MSRKVIIGAAGFIGFHLAKSFLDDGESEVILIDSFVNSKPDKYFDQLTRMARCKFFNVDAKNVDIVGSLIRKKDIVFNLAAINGTKQFYDIPHTVLSETSIPSILIPEICAKNKVDLYVYFGSSESYAGGVTLGITKIPTNESVPLVISDVNNPRWSYAAAKTIGEIATISANLQFGLQYQILRIHNFYGPRMGTNHVIPDLIVKFSAKNFRVSGCDQSRTFLYVNDGINYIKSLYKNYEAYNQIINIGSQYEIKINKLAEMIMKEIGKPGTIECEESPTGSVSRRVPDLTKLNNYIKLSETTLCSGISTTVSWYKENE